MAAKIRIKKPHDTRVRNGHLWLYSNEIEITEGEPVNGDIVDIFLFDGNYFASGFYNRNSLIAVRILDYRKIPDLMGIFKERLHKADDLRKMIYPESSAYRMVFSESDMLPGLIIDRYNDTYVLQINCAGIEKNISNIVALLQEDFGAKNIFTKHDVNLRTYEGLSTEDTVYAGEQLTEIISDGLVRFKVNFASGQKTGFFYDQRENRKFIRQFCHDKSVFDGFCNSGGFGLHAMSAGAKSVYFTDIAKDQLIQVDENISLNGLDKEKATQKPGDIFEVLEALINNGTKFDIVCVDPPAFAKNRKQIYAAAKGYEKLHKMALKILTDGGLLLSTSCSHYMNEVDYQAIINRASRTGKEYLQLLYKAGAAPDHPKHAGMDETAYLKFLVYRKIDLS